MNNSLELTQLSHQELSSIEIQTNEAYSQFTGLQPHLSQSPYLDHSNYEQLDTPEEVTQLSHQELSSIEIQTNEAYSQSTSLQPHLSQSPYLDQSNYEQLDTPEEVTQLSNQELSSIEIQSNEAYSQSTSLQPQLSQDSHLLTQLSHQELSSIEIQTNEGYSQSTSLQPHLSQDLHLDQPNYEQLDIPEENCPIYEPINCDNAANQPTQYPQTLSSQVVQQWVPTTTDIQHPVPYFVQWQAPQTLGQQNLAPIQTQPVHFRPVTVILQQQENVTVESSDLKCLNKECFVVVSVSLMLMIIFIIIGGPLTLGCTISGLVYLIKASQRGVDNKKKKLNEWGCGCHAAGGGFAVFSFPIWGCAVGCIVLIIIF